MENNSTEFCNCGVKCLQKLHKIPDSRIYNLDVAHMMETPPKPSLHWNEKNAHLLPIPGCNLQRLGFLWGRNSGADVNDVLKTLLPLRRHSRPGQLDWFSPTSLPPHLWQPNKGPQSHAEAQQRHKARAGVPDEDEDTSEMDGRGGEGKKRMKGRRSSECVSSEVEFNKVWLTTGGLKLI